MVAICRTACMLAAPAATLYGPLCCDATRTHAALRYCHVSKSTAHPAHQAVATSSRSYHRIIDSFSARPLTLRSPAASPLIALRLPKHVPYQLGHTPKRAQSYGARAGWRRRRTKSPGSESQPLNRPSRWRV